MYPDQISSALLIKKIIRPELVVDSLRVKLLDLTSGNLQSFAAPRLAKAEFWRG